MSFRYSRLCGTASDTVDAVKLKIRMAEYLKIIIKLTISKIWSAQFRLKKEDTYQKQNVKQNEMDFKRLEGKKLSVEFN